jgi:hypothetical protein
MKTEVSEVVINGVAYVRKDDVKEQAVKLDGLQYCIVRTYSAGVFAGYIKSRNKEEAEVIKARRLWYWDGAASLSQLAMEGVSKPENCKFPTEVDSVILTNVVEIIPCTKKAFDSIKGVKIWKS